ncbi:cuticle protein 19.8-like [Battus philenor]|uniref:cuticle protein 19.8-like n=1 Tax=Battus philenor TaxID=42288 RepID=UPI0035D08A97
MFQKLVIMFVLVAAASCMVLEPQQLYIPAQYQEPPRNYDYGYEVNSARTGDYKRQQETRRGGTVLGQYSLLQPDGLTRTVDYRADDLSGFNAVVNNEGRPYSTEQQQENDGSGRQVNNRPQENQYRQSSNDQPTIRPLTVENTALIHHVLRQYRHAH